MVETAERRRVVTKIPADAGKNSRIEFGKRIKVAAYLDKLICKSVTTCMSAHV